MATGDSLFKHQYNTPDLQLCNVCLLSLDRIPNPREVCHGALSFSLWYWNPQGHNSVLEPDYLRNLASVVWCDRHPISLFYPSSLDNWISVIDLNFKCRD